MFLLFWKPVDTYIDQEFHHVVHFIDGFVIPPSFEKDERELTHIAGEQEELVVGEEEEEESPGLEGVTACLVDSCRDVDAAAAVDGDHDGLRSDLDVGPADNASWGTPIDNYPARHFANELSDEGCFLQSQSQNIC